MARQRTPQKGQKPIISSCLLVKKFFSLKFWNQLFVMSQRALNPSRYVETPPGRRWHFEDEAVNTGLRMTNTDVKTCSIWDLQWTPTPKPPVRPRGSRPSSHLHRVKLHSTQTEELRSSVPLFFSPRHFPLRFVHRQPFPLNRLLWLGPACGVQTRATKRSLASAVDLSMTEMQTVAIK